MQQRHTHWGFNGPSSEEEIEVALSKLKRGKTGGKRGITSNLVVVGAPIQIDRLRSLYVQVLEEGSVVKDRRVAVIIPIPKKGDLRMCDNWRGISLLEILGKVLGGIIQKRL